MAVILLTFGIHLTNTPMKSFVTGSSVAPIVGGQQPGAQPGNRFVAIVTLPPLAIPDTPASDVQFISQVRAGLLPAEAQQQIRDLAARLDLTVGEMALVLATPERTFARRLGAKPAEKAIPLTKVQSERLLLLNAVAAHGLAVFEDQGKFNRWLRRPLTMLQDQSPLQLLDTATGFRLIDQLLGRIEYGVYS